MSAGDVLFVGWTGGSPIYKELPPQVQIEPEGDNISKRVTINRICFDKDKQAVIQQLPTGNAVISSVYIDTDGSTKTQTMGGGYTLLNVSDAPIGTGYSRISAVYSKVVNGIFEIGLPAGMSIACDAGKCQIKYNTTVLEEIDSGTGECTSGLELANLSTARITVGLRPFIDYANNDNIYREVDADGNVVNFINYQATVPRLEYRVFSFITTPRTLTGYGLSELNQIFSTDLLCNGVFFENVSLTNKEVFDSLKLQYNGSPLISAGIYQLNASSPVLTQTEIDDIVSAATQRYEQRPRQDTELVSTRFETFQQNIFDSEKKVAVTQEYPIYYRIIPTYELTYANWNYIPKLEWKKTGNKVTLQYGRAIIREYDVTGL